MKGYLYILKSEKTGGYYTGSSDNPERRLVSQHNQGFVRSTRIGIPWKIVFKQRYDSLEIARQVEYKLKKLKSRIIVERIIEEQTCKLKVN